MAELMSEETSKILSLAIQKRETSVVRTIFARHPSAHTANFAIGGGTDYVGLCVAHGFLTGLEIAKEHGYDIDSKVTFRGAHDWLIHTAISAQKVPIVSWLIEKGADLSVKNDSGSSVLPAYAGRIKSKLSDVGPMECLEVLECLVRRNLTWETELYTMRHPMPTICRLHSAWDDANAKIVEIVEAGARQGWALDATDLIEDSEGRMRDRSGLLAAIITGQKPLAIKLVELGARLDDLEEWSKMASPNDSALGVYREWLPDLRACVMRRQLRLAPAVTSIAASRRTQTNVF